MPMYLIVYHVSPTKEIAEDDVAGAYIAGYIETKEVETALLIVKEKIKELKWQIIEFEKATVVRKEDFDEDAENLEYYKQAFIDKEVYVIHSYPFNDEK